MLKADYYIAPTDLDQVIFAKLPQSGDRLRAATGASGRLLCGGEGRTGRRSSAATQTESAAVSVRPLGEPGAAPSPSQRGVSVFSGLVSGESVAGAQFTVAVSHVAGRRALYSVPSQTSVEGEREHHFM
jgi:hypothetical protein